GTFDFSTNWTRGPQDTSASAPMGQELASFLLGLPTSGSIDLNNSYAEQTREFSVYLQDDWRVTPRLTLNIGIRYELELPTTERFTRAVRQFDFSGTSPLQDAAKANYAANPIPQVPLSNFNVKGGLTFVGTSGSPSGLWEPDTNNIMPRFGLAYQLDN